MKDSSIWTKYEVEIKSRDKIFGGIPKATELLEGWLKGQGLTPPEAKQVATKTKDEVHEPIEPEDISEDIEKSWTTFKSDDTGLYIETRQIKAMLKEACGASKIWTKHKGLKSRIGDALFPKGGGGPDRTRIYLKREGEVITEPDGHEETVGHVSGPRGKMSILKRKDYVEQTTIGFELWIGNSILTHKVLSFLFEFGQELGLGADRSMEHGKFDTIKLDKIKE